MFVRSRAFRRKGHSVKRCCSDLAWSASVLFFERFNKMAYIAVAYLPSYVLDL